MLAMLISSKVGQTILPSFALTASVFLLSVLPCPAQEKANPTATKTAANENLKQLKTVAENSNYLATATEKEVLDFLQKLDDASPYASQTSIGKTTEGRSIHALIIAKEPKPALPLPKSDPRLVVVMIGGIHSGECDSKEALLALSRDMLAEATPKFLDQAILVFIPNFNADGNARVGALHRPGQEGPARGMGTRENAIGHDLNRDFIKLDSPEVRALVRMMDSWNVDVFFDCHTTNGSLHQYDLTYDIPHNPAANQVLDRWMRKDLLPKVTKDLGDQGYPMFYYGNFSRDQRRWDSFGHEPRYSTEYMGLRGKIGILVESYSYASYQRRIDASYLFVDACLDHILRNADKLRPILRTTQNEPPKNVALQGKVVAEAQPTVARGFSWAKSNSDANKNADPNVPVDNDHKNEVTPPTRGFPSPGDRKRKAEMVPTDFDVQLVNVGQAILSVDAPEYYFVPVDNAWAASRLRMHGIQMSWIDESTAQSVAPSVTSQYRITSKTDLPEFQFHSMRKVTASLETTIETLPWRPTPGWIVSTRQPLGILATYLLEPHSDDSLAAWNFFDPGLKANSVFPVLRLEGPMNVPAPLPPLGMFDPPAKGLAGERLSLEKIYAPNEKVTFHAPAPEIPKWLPNQDAYLIQFNGRWQAVDCQSGAMTPFDRPRRLADALSKLEAFTPSQANQIGQRLEVFDSKFENALIEHKGELYSFHAGTGNGAGTPHDTVRQLTHSPDQIKELAELSPTAKHVAFIHKNNLWVADCESTEVRMLTHDTDSQILNGKLDWVYQEEVYGRGKFKGYWWSPDGSQIAFLRLDETPVPHFQINNSLSFAQTLEETRYPKSGQPNPLVTLHVVDVATGNIQEVPLNDYAADDRLVVRVGWRPAPVKELVYQVQNRIQSKLDLCSYDTNSKKIKKLVQETSPAWVNIIDEPRWLPDGSFLWLSDTPNGRRHVYRIGVDGTRTALTSGDWNVKSIERISNDGKQAWLLGHRSSSIHTDVLRLDLVTNKLDAVGETTGTHRTSVSHEGNFYFDLFSDLNIQPQLFLRDHDGNKVRYVGGFRSDRFEFTQAAKLDLFTISARDGAALQSMIYKPTDFAERSAKKKLPVLIHVYAGPAAPTVENSWVHRSDLWHRYMAEQGICVLLCDNRSAKGSGAEDTWKVYKDLAKVEMQDLEDTVAWLKQQPWVDPDRIGIWGWSYGGYFTAYAMTHSKLFRAGIAGAPVTDWNNYDSIYTERYMSTPQLNPDGYKSSSVVAAAKQLHGRLMLIHGEIDDNVHMANTLQLAHALQKANKQFDLMVYPNNRHGIVDPDQSYHQYQLMTDFFKLNLNP